MAPASPSMIRRAIRETCIISWDCIVGGWLLFAFFSFRGQVMPKWGALVAAAGGIGMIAALTRGRGQNSLWGTVGRVVLSAVLLSAWLHALFGREDLSAPLFWLVAVITLCAGVTVIVRRAIERRAGAAPAEPLRWSVLLIVATTVLLPIYTTHPSGAGDAYWYVMMLSDFLAQTRAGVFPVWIGQTHYAFNGAFSPLHLAPGFQHAGWIVDSLTLRSLDFLTVKNIVLALGAIACAFSAYFSFRAMLPRAANLATLLGVAYVLCPGLMAALAVGDQYMTFLAAAFLPLALYALWRCFERNDMRGHLLLGAALAGLWLFHTPLGLWITMVCAPAYVFKLVLHRQNGREVVLLGATALTFVVLATLPFLTAFGLENVMEMPIVGLQVRQELDKVFPVVLQPLSAAGNSPTDYKPGYFALGASIAGLGVFAFRPRWSTSVLALGFVFIAAVTLPTPGFHWLFWDHLPKLVLKTTNVWAIQRLALLWAGFGLFVFAAALASLPEDKQRRAVVFFTLAAAASIGWSWSEASRLSAHLGRSVAHANGWQHLYAEQNLVLTRYPYSSFSAAPPYFSHGYMNPRFESRLLTRDDSRPLMDNFSLLGRSGTKIAEGRFTGVSDGKRPFYKLSPELKLQSGHHYILKTVFSEPTRHGWFQVQGSNLFREYILPDSGVGVAGQLSAPRGYGSLPSSSPYITLYTDAPGESSLLINFIQPDDQPVLNEIACAAFELWEYDPAALPIHLKTLLPYRVRVDSPSVAYLESPRMWLPNYRGKVNGKRVPVVRSPNNLCMVELESGINEAEIKYVPPLAVEMAYWTALLGWTAFGLVFIGGLLREAYGAFAENPANSSAPTGC